VGCSSIAQRRVPVVDNYRSELNKTSRRRLQIVAPLRTFCSSKSTTKRFWMMMYKWPEERDHWIRIGHFMISCRKYLNIPVFLVSVRSAIVQVRRGRMSPMVKYHTCYLTFKPVGQTRFLAHPFPFPCSDSIYKTVGRSLRFRSFARHRIIPNLQLESGKMGKSIDYRTSWGASLACSDSEYHEHI